MTKGFWAPLALTSLIAQGLRRFDPRRTPGRINGCQQTHSQAGTTDNKHILPLQMRRQIADKIHIGTQELMPRVVSSQAIRPLILSAPSTPNAVPTSVPNIPI